MSEKTLPPVSMINVGQFQGSASGSSLGGIAPTNPFLQYGDIEKPQNIARVNRLSKQSGLPPEVIEGDEEAIEQAVKALTANALAANDIAFRLWAEQNPRDAIIATEDTKALTGLSAVWDDAKKIPARAFGAGSFRVAGMFSDMFDTLADVTAATQSPINALLDAVGGAHGAEWMRPKNFLKEDRKRRLMHTTALNAEAERIADANRGNNRYTEAFLSGTESVMFTVSALATRSPALSTSLFFGATGADAFVDAREKGLSMGEATAYAVGIGGLEAGTEHFAMKSLMDVVSKRVPFFGGMMTALATEMTGEQINTVLSDMLRMVHLPENQGKTIEDFIAERPDAFIDTALAVLGGTGTLAAGMKTAEAASNMAQRIGQGRAAKEDAKFIDSAVKFARQSQMRELSPDSFRELMRRQAEEAGARDVFIPAEAVKAYQQSDSYDPDTDPFDPRRWELDDMVANGQDIVMPIEDFLTDVAPTPAFEALRDDMRLVGGGMSAREAMAAEEAMADLEAELTEQFEQSERAEREQRSIRERLVDRVAAQFGVSYSAPTARKIAELAVAREETRAARMGRDLSLQTLADLEVRQIMPEAARAIKAADQLDLVINAMQQGKPARYGKGDSLMRFLKKRGGLLDTGGDLKAMGVHHSFLKKGDINQGSMLGSSGLSDFGLDSALRAAVEAGYFPELDYTRAGEFADDLDVNALLEAIGDELAGNPRFVEWVDDNIREAADQLGDALRSAGFDPANMSEEQLREAIETIMVDDAIDVDAGYYEQEALPDTVEVDGVMRGTVNSNGQPLGRTVEEVENFWRWFGDSKAVDDQGRPLVVYHGTAADFEAFDNKKTGTNDRGLWGRGHYFSTTVDGPNSYALRAGDGAQILPVYVAITNPFVMTTGADFITRLPDGTNQRDLLGPNLDGSKIKDIALEGGHDGVFQIKPNGLIGDLVAFEPTQIKSINNRGTYDASDARILNQTDAPQGTVLYHGSPRNDLTIDGVEIVRASGQKQGKKGRVYGGFYAAAEDRISDAQGYAGEGGTIYRIELKPDAVIEEKSGDITRLTEATIAEYRARGVDVVVGKDPRGRTEYAILNKDAVASMGDNAQAPRSFNQTDMPARTLETSKSKKLADHAPVMWRETSTDRAGDFLPDGYGSMQSGPAGYDLVYLADTPEMALGQNMNNGVLLEFDTAGLDGELNKNKPNWQFGYLEQQGSEYVGRNGGPAYRKALRAVSVTRKAWDEAEAKMRRYDYAESGMRSGILAQFDALEDAGWVTEETGDLITYRRPDAAPRSFNQSDIEQPLYVVHNLSADKLRHADALGGLAAPSLAIARGDIGFDGFGEISLIGEPSMADPKGKGVRAFAADVYSPRQPRARYKVGKKAFEKMRKALAPVAEKFGLRFYASESDIERGGLSDLIGSDVAKAAWLESLGESVEVKFEEVQPPAQIAGYEGFAETDGEKLGDEPAFVAKVNRKKALAFKKFDSGNSGSITEERIASAWGARGEPVSSDMVKQIAVNVARNNKAIAEFEPRQSDRIDTYETGKAIDAAVKGREAEFNAWVSEQFGDMLGAAFFENEAGRKREYTLANVVKEMTRALRNGENWNYGAGNVRAAVAPEFKTLAAVKGARGDIIPEADALKDEVNGELLALADKFAPYAHNGDDFGFVDTFSDFLKDMAKGPRAVEQWQNEWFKSPAPQELLNEAAEFLEKLKTLPTEYFEIKMQRAVDFSEFSAAVVPANLPADARAILEGAGLDLVEYDGTPEGRQAAVQSIGSRVFFQERAESKPRGRIILDQNKRIIELFEGRNASTAVHELGHMWLEDFQADAAHAAVLLAGGNLEADRGASLQQVVNDWETIKKYFADNGAAIGEDGAIPVEAHELFARTAERYVMEGKSPSNALTELLRAFSAFMKRIYKTVDALRAPISPEVREVFDRLIATDAEIEAARESQGLSALFDDAMAAGMTEQEFSAYQRLIARGRDVAESKLLEKVMRAITVRETKLWKERAESISDEVAAGLDATPLMRAISLMSGKRAPRLPKIAAGSVRLWEAADGTYRKEQGDAEYYVDVPAGHAALKNAGDVDIMLPEELTGEAQPVPTGDAALRIDRAWLVERFGADALKLLPHRVPPLYADGGVHPEDIAQRAGYHTADEMINALIGAEKVQREERAKGDKRPMRKRMLEEAVKIEMGRRYGDPLHDGSIEREAMDAVRNDEAGELMATELRVLSRGAKAADKITPWRVAKAWARKRVREGEVRREASAAAVARYQRAAAKAAREAELALAANDRDGAFAAKHKQMMNSALASEAAAAVREVEAAQARLSKIAKARTRKSVDQDYLERAQALLEAVDLKRRSQILIDRAGKFAEWAAEQEANGIDIAVPAGFEAVLSSKNWTRLSIDEFIALDDAVKQIMHLGRLKQTLKDEKEARDFEEVLQEAEQVATFIGRKPLPSHLDKENWLQAIKRKILSIDAALLKMEQIFLWLDDGNRNGVFHRYVFRPLALAQERERQMIDQYQKEIMGHMDALPDATKKRWADKVAAPFIYRYGPKAGQPVVLERSQVIAMALNWGNAGNRQRLLDGEGWNETQMEAFLYSTLDAAEWQFVQNVWDTIGKLWPEIQRVEKNVNGFAPEAVDAVEFDTPHGRMRGGYYPAVYDPRGSDAAQDQEQYKDGLLGSMTVRATTRASATKERAEAVKGRPLLYDLSVISRHLGEVIHDITHREALVQANKLLSHPRIRQLTRETINPEVEKLFKPWLKQIADSWASDRAGLGMVANVLQAMRANVTVVAMGWRFTTMMTQISGYANALEMMRKRDLLGAFARYVKSPVETTKFILENSLEMRGRIANLDANIAAVLDKMENPLADKRKRVFTAAKRFAFHGIGYMDRLVTLPVWIGSYDAAVKRGLGHDDAIAEADGVVRLSQGASGAKDLAAIQSGQGKWGEAAKNLTFFYTYFSAFYNRQRNLGRDFRRIESVKEMPALLARAWWLFVVPPLLAEVLAGRAPDDDEDEFGWAMSAMVSNFVGGVPIVRDIVPLAFDKLRGERTFGYRYSPISGLGESVDRFLSDINRVLEGKETKRMTRNTIELIGYSTGLTTGQMGATAQFLVDVAEGDAQPDGFWEWYEGLTKGKIADD